MLEKILAASEVQISGLKKNDIFVEIDLVLCTTKPNKNKESVTEAFIDEVVSHPEIYTGIPLYCDIKNLLAGNYGQLTHMQNLATGTFKTSQIGSLLDFRKEKDGDVCMLIATARVPKREKQICLRLWDMYLRGILCFSFEACYVEADTQVNDGTRFIDESDRNYIFGMTVVSHPAFVDSVALSLVAEDMNVAANERNEDETMNDLNPSVATPETSVEQSQSANPETVVAEEQNVATAEQEANAPAAEAPATETVASVQEGNESGETTSVAEVAPVENQPETSVAEATEPVTQTATAEDDMCPLMGAPAPEETVLDAEVNAGHAEIAAQEEQLQAQISQLKAEIDLLRAEHAELEAFRAAKHAEELRARQDQARAFAEQQNLDMGSEDVQHAIAEVNYEALATLSMQNAPVRVSTAETKDTVNLANLSESTVIQDVCDNRAWLFERS